MSDGTTHDVLIDKVKELTDLSTKDVEDLLKLKGKQLQEVLADYRLANKLNEAQLKGLLGYLKELTPFYRLGQAIARLLK